MKNRYSNTDKKFLEKIGKNIKKLREARELSQEAFAFKAKLDRTYISGIERGERNISLLTLNKIADALDIKVTSLLNGNGK